MREYTRPGEVPVEPDEHLLEPVIDHAEATPDRPLLARPDDGGFADVTAGRAWERIRALAAGLIGLGVEAGDRVAIMSPTRIEFLLLDYAVLACGAVTVPIYETDSAEQVEWICTDSDVRVAIFADEDLKGEYDRVADRVAVQRTFVIDAGGLDELQAAGEDVDDGRLDERIDGLRTDDLATIIYTSGTTGRPKGCQLTHGNLRWDVRQTLEVIGDMVRPDDRHLLFLPLAHSFAKILALCTVEVGAQLAFSRGTDDLRDEMPVFRPTFLASVPRVFEKVWAAARQQAEADGRAAVLEHAAGVAEDVSRARMAGRRASLLTRAQHTLFDRLVFAKLRTVFGGQLRYAVSGGGPLSPELAHMFHGMGIRVLEGYGLTETSPVLTCNQPDRWKIGTVGLPVPGTTIRIADDGEILATGGQIFRGYHDNPEATDEVIDADGWFHTGDLGELDADGFLSITGRKKEMLVTAGGKNVAPAVLEDRITSHPLVSQAMVVGDNRPFVAALLTLDEELLEGWARRHDRGGATVEELVDDPRLQAELQEAVDHANAAVSRAESVRQFRVLPRDFSIEGGELTPTMKVKRRVVEEAHADTIESIYD